MSDSAHAATSELALPAIERTATGMPNGRLGMWWFLASEICVFGGMICIYVLFRLSHPAFAEAASHTLLAAGALNTFILLTSSLTVVLAHAAAEERDRARVLRFEALTILLGLGFLCVKGFEYTHEIGEGFTPKAGLFWGFYFVMTGLHGLHVIAGMIAHAWACYGVASSQRFSRIAPVGLYWHFVDVVWIFLFPLLYIAS